MATHANINKNTGITDMSNEKIEAGLTSHLTQELDCVFEMGKRTGVPFLKLIKIKRSNAYTVCWGEGSLTCYDHFNFKNKLGNKFDDELIVLWNNAKNRLGKKSAFLHGGISGAAIYIPYDLALIFFNTIKKRFTNALEEI